MQEVKQIIHQIRTEGKAFTDPVSGAELFTPIEEIRSGYLYELFPALSEEEILSLCQSYTGKFPEELLEFYRITNGGNFFCRYIRIAGMPYSPLRFQNCKIPDALRHVDLHRTKNTPREWLFFATYKDWKKCGQAHVCLDCSAPGPKKPVYCLPYDGDEIWMRWDSFEQWFCSEFDRFDSKYSNGDYEIYDIVPGVMRGIRFAE